MSYIRLVKPDEAVLNAAAAAGLAVVHADEHVVVLDKPAGMASVPGRGALAQLNLATQAQARWPDALAVHRLDMATSGLLVFARGAGVHAALSAAFRERRVHKRYVAVVDGCMRDDAGEIDLPLGADWPHRPKQQVDRAHGKPSLTAFRVLHRDAAWGATWLELTPVTGRSHQLRVHLMAVGHPILGDTLYADARVSAAAPRLLLHAAELGFSHPADGRACHFRCPVPFAPALAPT